MLFDFVKVHAIARDIARQGDQRGDLTVPAHYFHLFYVLEGQGMARCARGEYHIKRDDLILLPPGEELFTCSRRENEPHFLAIGFSTQQPRFWQELMNCSHTVIEASASKRSVVQAIIESVCSDGEYQKDVINYLVTGLLLEFLLPRQERGALPVSLPASGGDADGVSRQMERIMEYIEQNYAQNLTLEQLAAIICVTPGHLCKLFRSRLGLSPIQYINQYRIARAKVFMSCTEMSITEIAERVGFSTIHYFCRLFKEKVKMSPTQYRMSAGKKAVLYLDESAPRHSVPELQRGAASF